MAVPYDFAADCSDQFHARSLERWREREDEGGNDRAYDEEQHDAPVRRRHRDPEVADVRRESRDHGECDG
jgi:hypothetical protein